MNDESRRYRKRKRAMQEEQTRQRITEAVMELHRTVGPARTKVTEVAERAGVSRPTVYNHFPTEGDLIEACSSHWAARNPVPDPAAWAAIAAPGERLRTALAELYAWYRDTEAMMGNVLRDAAIVEPLGRIMDERWSPYMDAVVDVLSEGWGVPRPALRMVVDFGAWRLLAGSGTLGDPEAADVAARMVAAVADEAAQEAG